MAGYLKHTEIDTRTDGGEATPRPRRAQRLVEVMDGEMPRRKPPVGFTRESAPLRRDDLESSVRASAVYESAQGSVTVRASDSESAPRVAGQPCESPFASIPASAPDGCVVLSVTPEGAGETVAVVLSMPTVEGGKPGRVKLHLLVEQYADLSVKLGALTQFEVDGLLEAGRLCAAIRRGMGLLQYGDRSARRLTSKLTARGVDRDTAAAATAYLVRKGYIREDDTARLRAEQSVRKGWGPLRIREDLRAQGFASEVVEEAMESLAQVDFEENCAAVIRKKYGSIPEDRAVRRKMTAALMRLGYDIDGIREAMRRVLRDEE